MPPNLTPEQQQVVQDRRSHQRVIAVAGSGKTATLLAQARALLADGVPPRRILVLMYNRGAQQAFQQRLQAEHGGPLPDIRTFHSLGLSIYRTLIQREHLTPYKGEILSDQELEPRVWRWLQELAETGEQAQDVQANRRKWVEPAMTFVERVKAGLAPPEEVFESLGMNLQARPFIRLFERLEQWRREQKRITFADMLYDPVRLFHQQPDIAQGFADHLDYIIVDEYQDINACQHHLLDVLAGQRARVTIVGDPDQTIYQFRGSNPDFMLHHFPTRYPDAQRHTLSHSFRFGPSLADLANRLITHNKGREAVTTRAHASANETRVELLPVADDVSATIDRIRRWGETEGHQWSDIAVLHRLWAQSAQLELQLMTIDIPFRLEHSGSVLQRAELRPLLTLLSMASGRFQQQPLQARQEGWMSLLTQPYPKIQRQLLTRMASHLARHPGPPSKAMQASMPDRCSNWQQEQLALRTEVIRLAEQGQVSAPRVVAAWLNNTDYLNAFASSAFSAQQGDEQKETVQAFLAFLRQHERAAADTDQWLTDLMAQRQAQAQAPNADQGVLLTSIHKAKGREWPCVVVPGLNQHFYPYRPDGDLRLPVDEESERRLLYVALTRARRHLILLTPEAPDQRSVFTGEMGLLPDAGTRPPNSGQQPGQAVQHPHFGRGEIVREDPGHYHIRFNDGQTRVFVREIADGLLTRPS